MCVSMYFVCTQPVPSENYACRQPVRGPWGCCSEQRGLGHGVSLGVQPALLPPCHPPSCPGSDSGARYPESGQQAPLAGVLSCLGWQEFCSALLTVVLHLLRSCSFLVGTGKRARGLSRSDCEGGCPGEAALEAPMLHSGPRVSGALQVTVPHGPRVG